VKPTSIPRRDVLRAIGVCSLMAGVRGAAWAQPGASSPSAKVSMENDRVRVYSVLARPGQSILDAPAANNLPRLAVFMSGGKVRMASAGGKPEIASRKTGDILWSAGDGMTAENAGAGDISVFLVEPRGKPAAAVGNPKWRPTAVEAGGRILYENDYLRVIEHAARPRMGVCGEGMHTHLDHLTIGLTAARVRIEKPNADPTIEEIPAGAVFWDPSGPHSVMNVGSRNARAFLVEIKTA